MKAASLTRQSRGFTLVEVVGVIAALAVISGIGIVAVTNTREAAAASKLEQDVESINRSVQIYLSNGGTLEGVTETDAVLAKLKSRSDRRVMGVSGSVLDARIVPDYGNASSRLRAVWRPSPDNRFELVQGTSGVVEFRLDEDIAANAAETETDRTPTKELATVGGWVWDNTGANIGGGLGGAGGTGSEVSSSPTLGTGTSYPGGNGTISALAAPSISPSGGTSPLSGFPKTVTITHSNPPGSSQIYYSVDGGGYVLYSSPISASPGQISAVAVSLDPSRYSNSTDRTETYYAQVSLDPWNTSANGTSFSARTYTELSDATPDAASITANGTGPFTIRYTTDGSAPTASSTAYSGSLTLTSGMWTSASLTLSAKAFVTAGNPYYLDSEVVSTPIAATPVALNTPTISPGSQIVFGSIPVTVAKNAADPNDTRLFYTTNGATPTSSSTPYSGPFVISGLGVNEQRVVQAIASGPSGGSGFWFTDSSPASVTYTGLNFDYYNLDGVLIGGGTINNNASLNGSVVLVSVNGVQPSVTFNNNAALEGDIYAPGTPTVVGVPAARVINLDGATEPTNYTITMNKADFTGNVYRRITPVTMPAVTLPTELVERGNATPGTLQPGHYDGLNGSNGGTFTLGVAGATEPSHYVFDAFSVGNNAHINIVGPVTITFNTGVGTTVDISNNAYVGNPTHPEWLQINMFTGNIRVANNGYLWGSVLNPNGSVTFDNNSTFTGGVTAKYLNINNNGSGIVFSLPPPSSQ